MFKALFYIAAIAACVYLLTYKYKPKIRIIVALLVLVILTILLFFAVIIIGDRSLPGSVPYFSSQSFTSRLSEAVITAKKTGSAVNIDVLTDFDWDTVVIFPPYSSQSEINKTLGYDWAESVNTGIGMDDTINLIVFVKSGEVTRYFLIPRGVVDFKLSEQHTLLSRDIAKFVVYHADETGRNFLTKAEPGMR